MTTEIRIWLDGNEAKKYAALSRFGRALFRRRVSALLMFESHLDQALEAEMEAYRIATS